MDYSVRTGSIARMRAGCAIVGVFKNGELSQAASQVDVAMKGTLKSLAQAGDLPCEGAGTLVINRPSGISPQRLLVVCLGEQGAYDAKALRRAAIAACEALGKTGAKDVACALDIPGEMDGRSAARHIAEAFEHASYRYTHTLGSKGKTPALSRCVFVVDKSASAGARHGIATGKAIGEGVALARELGNLPANVCTPTHLANTAKEIGRGVREMTVKILSAPEIKKLKMGAFLSVTQGAKEPPRLIVMEYRGGKKGDAPIALIGKGITFDTGGICIKPAPSMDEMKYDMGGAAGVLGTMLSLTKLALPINVMAVVPTCENMPSGTATRPGDVVRSMSGKTIEVLNTDAEGRLILCDAITYARRFKPRKMIDVATLTGACVIALGAHYTGLMSNHDGLADELLEAGVSAEDVAWRLPIGSEYTRQLKSNFADLANVGGRPGGAITAACFLSEFAGKTPWAHLDIAGTAWVGGKNKGGTGRPVSLLSQFLINNVP